jgi:predicted MFS family arabinose efflux permease
MIEGTLGSGENREPINERLLLLVLAAVQFTAIVDFLIILPLGPQYLRLFHITPAQFGIIVSAYAVSAGISGFAAGLFLDRFDRKAALIALYSGFALGTLCCGLAPSYPLLVAARVVAGAFGGVAGALILAIIGDVVPEERRGAAMGLVMSSFSVASICGVPIGLVLASRLNWHVPFYVLAGLSLVILAASAKVLPALRDHLNHARSQHPVTRLLAVLMHADHQMAFLFMALLTFTGFLIFPNMANYMVWNVGLTEAELPLIYLATVPILLLTDLPKVPLAAAIGTSTLLMICMSGRMVPAMALMTGTIEARYRGGFMSINSSVQQFASGVAALFSGQILGQTSNGSLTHFPYIGAVSVVCALACIYLARFLKSPAPTGSPAESLAIQG